MKQIIQCEKVIDEPMEDFIKNYIEENNITDLTDVNISDLIFETPSEEDEFYDILQEYIEKSYETNKNILLAEYFTDKDDILDMISSYLDYEGIMCLCPEDVLEWIINGNYDD